MAIDPSEIYPQQVDTTDPTGYPLGKPKNSDTPHDGLGFPLEARWLQDLFGFQQALLTVAGIAPSGTPDKADASQYLEALTKLFRTRSAADGRDPIAACYRIDRTQPIQPVTFATPSLSRFAEDGFTLEDSDRAIRLPSRGLYSVSFHFQAQAPSDSAAVRVRGTLTCGGSVLATSTVGRRSTDPTHYVEVAASVPFLCTDTDDLVKLSIGASTGSLPSLVDSVVSMHWLGVTRLRSDEDDTP